MHLSIAPNRNKFLVILMAALMTLLTAPKLLALTDPATGFSPIWELLYSGQNLNPFADDDGDGFNNLQESIAGTDPRDPHSHPIAPAITISNGSVVLAWHTVAGKAYQVQTSATMGAGAVWTNLGQLMLADGSDLSLTCNVASTKQFFRIVVADHDTTNGGVTDWEKLQLGLDPYRTDNFKTGLGDRQMIVNALNATDVINLNLTKGVATAAFGDNAVVTFLRSGNIDPIKVSYTVSGTGVSGSDFLPLSGIVSFPLGVNSVDVPVVIGPGFTIAKNVTITLAAGTNYTVGSNSSVAVRLYTQPAPSGSVVQEFWYSDDVAYTTPAQFTKVLTKLDSSGNGANYQSRIRGFIRPSQTGNFTFWVAGDDVSSFSLSTDSSPANLQLLCYSTSWTNYQQWNKYPSQQSAPVKLASGQKYYFEATLTQYSGGDSISVGWLTPGQTGSAPSAIVPGANLLAYNEPYTPPGLSSLYFARLSPAGSATSAAGFVSLRLSQDGTIATVSLQTSGLTGSPAAINLCGPASGNSPGPVLVNLSNVSQQPDGSYLWSTTASIASMIQGGQVSLNLPTAANPSGELSGRLLRFAPAQSPGFTPPPPPPSLPSGLPTASDANRFLTQATFGATSADLAYVQQNGFQPWLDQQFAMPPTLHENYLDALAASGNQLSIASSQEAFWNAAVTAPDQLRQRVAFALSNIMVISDQDDGIDSPYAVSGYYDVLLRYAFSNFRQLIEGVTLSPAMGVYLDMLHNDKPNPLIGSSANENYGREVMQLFTIGLVKLNPDGSTVLDGGGNPISTYQQPQVVGMARIFTGWNFAQNGSNWNWVPENWRQPMQLVPDHHDTLDYKQLLDGVVIPPDQPPYQDLKDALDLIFYHQNCGPFICRQLIQRLVTSNPSPGYIYRVAQVFNDDGTGVRGNMKAVITAILLDYEARNPLDLTNPNFGKEREPIVRLATVYRAFGAAAQDQRYQVSESQLSGNYGEALLDAPTVFNFFSPFYSEPGEIEAAGLVSPEFQILTDAIAISSSNDMRWRIGQNPSLTDPTVVTLNLNSILPLATSNPGAMLDNMASLLLGGPLPSKMRSYILSVVAAVPYTNPTLRAQTAIQYLATSPEFCIQK